MPYTNNYPIISIFVDEVHSILKSYSTLLENNKTDTTFVLSSYSKISNDTREKSLLLAHELVSYFTENLLLHHYQEDVPVLTVYLGVNEEQININLHGGYYLKFIENIPVLQEMLDDLLLMVKNDLQMTSENAEKIIKEIERVPRIDIKENLYDADNYEIKQEELEWFFTRIVRTPNSEVYALYLNGESAGQIHIHIGKIIDATIIATLEIAEREKAELMGLLHEDLLEYLELEYNTHSTIKFFSEAVEDYD